MVPPAPASRYGYAADALAALVLATDGEMTATAETVRAYIFLRLPAGFFAVPLPNGGIDMTATAIFRITREPCVRRHTVRLSSKEGPTVAALARLVDSATHGDRDADRILVALNWFVKAHAYALDTRASSNLGDLATALARAIERNPRRACPRFRAAGPAYAPLSIRLAALLGLPADET